MVKVNFWEGSGGAATVTELSGTGEYAAMLLFCGPLHWSWKQNGIEKWGKDGPKTIRITVTTKVGEVELTGATGRYERGAIPDNPDPNEPDGDWAVSIPLDQDLFELLRGIGTLTVTGNKEYEGTFPDIMIWAAELPVQFALKR